MAISFIGFVIIIFGMRCSSVNTVLVGFGIWVVGTLIWGCSNANSKTNYITVEFKGSSIKKKEDKTGVIERN